MMGGQKRQKIDSDGRIQREMMIEKKGRGNHADKNTNKYEKQT